MKHDQYSNGRVTWSSNGPYAHGTNVNHSAGLGCLWQLLAVLIVAIIVSGNNGIDLIIRLCQELSQLIMLGGL